MSIEKTSLPSFILTLSCADQRGIVMAVSRYLTEQGANIDEAAQFGDTGTGKFFMRVVFSVREGNATLDTLSDGFGRVAETFGMDWKIFTQEALVPTVLLASKIGHCLHDLLQRWKAGLLPIDVRAIVSNHRDFEQLAASHQIPFHYIPVTPETKQKAEAELVHVVEAAGAELVVLARYMQVLSNDLCKQLAGKAINIHHSFLPGFKGARPYYQAHERGVKLIGATAHYVTGDLDEGPIIEQDVQRADHSMNPIALTALGRDVESLVLARAVKWHAERRVILNGSSTVIFR